MPERFLCHPTQKPEALLSRILLAASNKGDVVLGSILWFWHHRRRRKRLRAFLYRHRT
jgi:hypothetical protein